MKTLTITVTEEGQGTVSGPIGEKVWCYGVLEVARQVIQGYGGPRVVPATVVPRIVLDGGR